VEREQMIRWVHARLDELQVAEANGPKISGEEFGAWLAEYGPEIEAAERGNIEPLRKKLLPPHLAKYFVAAKIKTKRHTKRDLVDAIATAAWAYKHIPEIWKKEYALKNRRKGQVSALEIAALWMKEYAPGEQVVFEATDRAMNAILTRLKPSGPSGKKRRAPKRKFLRVV
jgi:hypothetical protein